MIKNWWNKLSEPADKKSGAKQPTAISKQYDIASNIALLVAEVLRSNNTFTDEEEQFATQFFEQQFPYVKAEKLLDAVRNHFTIGSRPMLKITCRQLLNEVDESSHRLIIRFLLGVAASDNFIHAREMRCIERIAQYLMLSNEEFETIQTEFVAKNSPYALLGVRETATLSEVKKAYRAMILKCHPDKRAAGKTEQEAAKEFRAVQYAYEIILTGYAIKD